jgi:hypothetical protein
MWSSLIIITFSTTQPHITPTTTLILQVFHSFDHSNVNAVSNVSFDLWHYRLDHPSFNVSHTMCKKLPYISINKNLICDSCHLAKQYRLSFSNSIANKTMHAFELVHMGIYGDLLTLLLWMSSLIS